MKLSTNFVKVDFGFIYGGIIAAAYLFVKTRGGVGGQALFAILPSIGAKQCPKFEKSLSVFVLAK